MANTFHVTILTPERTSFEGEAYHLQAPGTEGYLGILANHAPLLTGIEPGLVTLTPPDGGADTRFVISGGFLEVARNRVTVLADAIEQPAAIEVDRARRSAERARERLRKQETGTDLPRAEASLRRALNRLRWAENAAAVRR